MSSLRALLNHPYAAALAWSLGHFLWQGAAIGLAAFAILRSARLSARARYLVGIAALAAMLAAPVITFVRLASVPVAAAGGTLAAGSDGTLVAVGSFVGDAGSADAAPPAIAAPWHQTPIVRTTVLALWTAGVLILSLRLLGGWIVATRVARRDRQPAAHDIQAVARRVADRLALHRVVGVFTSTAVVVPVMIGWLKPVILLPTAALAGLSPDQLEALLAHELAHVRRHDYLVNLLQSVVETLLFYHPAVWWLSKRVRAERELCCDDLTIAICDRLVYATALTDLAAMTTTPRMALAATDGPLLHRVRRILGRTDQSTRAGAGWISAIVVVAIGSWVAPAVVSSAQRVIEPARVVTPAERARTQTPVTADTRDAGLSQTDARQAQVVQVEQARALDVATAERAQTAEVRERAAQGANADAEARQRLTNVQDQLAELELKRVLAESERDMEQSKSKLMALEAGLQSLRVQMASAKDRAAAGVIGPTELAKLQADLEIAMQQLGAQKADYEYQLKVKDLRAQQAMLERKLAAERAGSDVSRNLVEMQKRAEAETAKIAPDYRKAYEGAPLDPNALAQTGDVLSIVVKGEPDLPRSFIVSAAGTIRMPFVGDIDVKGLTAAKIAGAVADHIAKFQRTNSKPAVDVSIRRPPSAR